MCSLSSRIFVFRCERLVQWKTDARKELLEDHKAKAVDYSSAEGLKQHALEVQQESKESLQRSLGKAHETLQIGKETAAKLEQQTEQMAGMANKLDEIDDTLV